MLLHAVLVLAFLNYNLAVKLTARGLVTPVFTPLRDDQSINYDVLSEYAEFLACSGLRVVLVGGTASQNMVLKLEDRKRVLDAWVDAANESGLRVMAQVGGAPLDEVLQMAEYAASIPSVEAIVTLPELYFKPTSIDELVFYVGLVAKTVPNKPVVYYHFPNMTAVSLSMPEFVVSATKKIDNFKGIKFTSDDLSEALRVKRNLREDQVLYLASDDLLAPATLMGIHSSIGTGYNLFPSLAQDIVTAVLSNDNSKARRLQEKFSLAIEAITVGLTYLPAMKAGMEIVTGIRVGPPSLPQRPVTYYEREIIKERLTRLGVLRNHNKCSNRKMPTY